MTKQVKKSPFELALEARQKKLDPKFLPSNARLIYRDNTISNDDLASYVGKTGTVERTKELQKPSAPMR